MCKKIAFITAGGMGDRMRNQTPKQFLELQNIPVIVHTLLKFERNSSVDIIIVVCLHGWENHLWNLARKFNISKLSAVVPGGDNSQESIFNGIGYLIDNNYDRGDIIIVHESVRPFITDRIINDNIETCARLGNAVTAIRGNESCIYSEDGIKSDKTFLRESIYMVQTPQTFLLGDLADAYEVVCKNSKVFQSLFLIMSEFNNNPLNIVKGERFNIKLTYPEDLKIFDMLSSLKIDEW